MKDFYLVKQVIGYLVTYHFKFLLLFLLIKVGYKLILSDQGVIKCLQNQNKKKMHMIIGSLSEFRISLSGLNAVSNDRI